MSFNVFSPALDHIDTEHDNVQNLIRYFFDDATLGALLYTCLRVDIADNNSKAQIIQKIIGPEFREVGTGTNRAAYRKNGMVVKVALDRRGLIDNFCEYKRSVDEPVRLAKTYESNYLINICEYVNVMDQQEFAMYQQEILEVLRDLSKRYLFDDIGYTFKNSYNWGLRPTTLSAAEKLEYNLDPDDTVCDIVVLDYGYLYPLRDQRDKLFRCPKCKHKLAWNANFTMLGCTSSTCGFQCSPTQLRRRMNLDYEEYEAQSIADMTSTDMPDLHSIEQLMLKLKSRRERKS